MLDSLPTLTAVSSHTLSLLIHSSFQHLLSLHPASMTQASALQGCPPGLWGMSGPPGHAPSPRLPKALTNQTFNTAKREPSTFYDLRFLFYGKWQALKVEVPSGS